MHISLSSSFTWKPNDIIFHVMLMGMDGNSANEWKWCDLIFMGWTIEFLSLQAWNKIKLKPNWAIGPREECWACQTKTDSSKDQSGGGDNSREHMWMGEKGK